MTFCSCDCFTLACFACVQKHSRLFLHSTAPMWCAFPPASGPRAGDPLLCMLSSSPCCAKTLQQKIGERPFISLWIVKSEFCDKTLGTYCPLTQAIQVLQPVLCHLPCPTLEPMLDISLTSPCACMLAPQSNEEGELGELWSSEKGTSI